MGLAAKSEVDEVVVSSGFSEVAGSEDGTGGENDIMEHLLIELQSLLQIDGDAEGRHFPELMGLKSYDDFFDELGSCPPEAPPRTRARFNAVKRHGNCRTRKAVIIRPQKYDEACDLTPSEWGKLLKPLLYNSSLQELFMLGTASIDSLAVKEQIYTTLGEVLRISKSLKYLFLEIEGLSAGYVAKLAQGLQGNSESTLEALIIIGRPQLGTMNYLWGMIHKASKLRHLWLKRIGALDDAAVKDWSEALRQSTSLFKLTLEGVEIESLAKLLTDAFPEGVSRPKQSIKELELIEIHGAASGWKQFFDFLSRNVTFTSLGISGCSFDNPTEVFGDLVDAVEANFILRKVKYDGVFSETKNRGEGTLKSLLMRNAEFAQYSAVLT